MTRLPRPTELIALGIAVAVLTSCQQSDPGKIKALNAAPVVLRAPPGATKISVAQRTPAQVAGIEDITAAVQVLWASPQDPITIQRWYLANFGPRYHFHADHCPFSGICHLIGVGRENGERITVDVIISSQGPRTDPSFGVPTSLAGPPSGSKSIVTVQVSTVT